MDKKTEIVNAPKSNQQMIQSQNQQQLLSTQIVVSSTNNTTTSSSVSNIRKSSETVTSSPKEIRDEDQLPTGQIQKDDSNQDATTEVAQALAIALNEDTDTILHKTSHSVETPQLSSRSDTLNVDSSNNDEKIPFKAVTEPSKTEEEIVTKVILC